MTSVQTVNAVQLSQPNALKSAETPTLWSGLSVEDKALVAAYIEFHYSVVETASALGLDPDVVKHRLTKKVIKNAITEVQADLDSLDYLNEHWVKSQLVRIFPMVMGEVEVPFIDNTGMSLMGRKFQPDIAMRIIEHVSPKKTQAPVQVTINNINRLSDKQLEELAMKGVVSTQ